VLPQATVSPLASGEIIDSRPIRIRQHPHPDANESCAGEKLQRSRRKILAELTADEDCQETCANEGTGRSEKNFEPTTLGIRRKQQCRQLGLISEFGQEDRHKNRPQ